MAARIPNFGIISNTNPNITYSGEWTTTHATNTPQSYLSFSFLGETVIIQATIPAGNCAVNVAYSVDEGPLIPVSAPCGTQATLNTNFFDVNLSTAGPHDFILVYIGDPADTSFFFMGFLLVSHDTSTLPAIFSKALAIPPVQATTLSAIGPTSSIPSTPSKTTPPPNTPGPAAVPTDSELSNTSAEGSNNSIVPSSTISVSESTQGQPLSATSVSAPKSSLPVSQTGSGSIGNSGATATSPMDPAIAQTTRLFLSASTNTAAARSGTGISTPTSNGSNPPFIGNGSPTANNASSHQNVHIIQGAVSSSAFLITSIIIAFIWFYRQRRMGRRFWARLDDEGSLIPRESRSTLVSTTPRPFILARIWSAMALSPQKYIAAENVIPQVTRPEMAMTRSRTSSVTTATMVPEYQSRLSRPSVDFISRENSISDAPPTYYSGRNTNFGILNV